MSTVVCSVCKKETNMYSFDSDLRPVCMFCLRGEELEKTLVDIHEERLERAWNGKDVKLDGWFK